jgi:hypothetical protein
LETVLNEVINSIEMDVSPQNFSNTNNIAADIHEATSKATPVDADEIGIWNSVGGVLGKLTWANLKATLLTYFYTIFPAKDGWMPVSDNWAYASGTTITVPAGAALIYSPGDLIRWKQGGAYLYGSIVSVTDTVLTIVGSTVLNQALTDIAYSKSKSPVGLDGRVTLGYAEITTNFASTIASNAYADVSGLSVTINIPTGGRRIKITAYTGDFFCNNTAEFAYIAIREGTNVLSIGYNELTYKAGGCAMCVLSSFVAAAGSHTYKISIAQSSAGTMTLQASPPAPAFILVEAI